MAPQHKRWLWVSVLLAVPVVLGLVMREQWSWRPQIIKTDLALTGLALSPDGRLIACDGDKPSRDHEVQVREFPSGRLRWGQEVLETVGNGPGYYLKFSPDGSHLVGNSWDNVWCYDVKTSQVKQWSFNPYGGIVVTDGNWLDDATIIIGVSGQTSDKTLPLFNYKTLLFDARTGRLQRRQALQEIRNPPRHVRGLERLCIAPQGRTIAALVLQNIYYKKTEPHTDKAYSFYEVWLWDTMGRLRHIIRDPHASHMALAPDSDAMQYLHALELSPQGDKLAAIMEDFPGKPVYPYLAVFDVKTGKLLYKADLDPFQLRNYEPPLCFSPDGSLIAYGINNNAIRIR